MSALDTESFRKTLLEERQRVVHAISNLHGDNSSSLEDESDEIVSNSDNHLAETASATVDREIDYTLEENSEHVLAEIDDALTRIDEGTFGTCRTCGRPIGEERLSALPYTTQCIDCKRKAERG